MTINREVLAPFCNIDYLLISAHFSFGICSLYYRYLFENVVGIYRRASMIPLSTFFDGLST